MKPMLRTLLEKESWSREGRGERLRRERLGDCRMFF